MGSGYSAADPLNPINSQYCCNQIQIPGAIARVELLGWFILVSQLPFLDHQTSSPGLKIPQSIRPCVSIWTWNS